MAGSCRDYGTVTMFRAVALGVAVFALCLVALMGLPSIPYAQGLESNPLSGSQSSLTVSSDDRGSLHEQGDAVQYDTPIAAGTYLIMRSAAEGQLIESPVAGNAAKTGPYLFHATGNARQVWRVSYDGNGRYSFVNKATGKALGIKGGSAKNGARICLARPSGSLSQKWIAVKSKGGYQLQSAKNRKFVISCAGNKKADKTKLQLSHAKELSGRRFVFVSTKPQVESARTVADGIYMLKFATDAGMLGVADSSAADGANVIAAPADDSTDQRWHLVCGKDGFYTLRNVQSGLMLEVDDSSVAPGANIRQGKADRSNAQKWAIRANADGSYSLISKSSGMALVAKSSGKALPANAQTALPKKVKDQKLTLKEVPLLADGVYTVYTGLSRVNRVLQIKDGATAGGAHIVLGRPQGILAQRFQVKRLADGTYSFQVVASGKYLSESKGKAVQRSRPAKGLSRSMRWSLEPDGSGIALVNVASGKRLAVVGGKAASGAKLKTASRKASAAQRFRFVSETSLIPQGMYTIRAQSGRFWLGPQGIDAEAGEALCLTKDRKSNYQKFILVPARDGWYRIVSALSDLVLKSGNAGEKGSAPVRMAKRASKASQLWKPYLTDCGIVFKNKATGLVLEFSGNSAKKGSGIHCAKASGKTRQGWYLTETKLDMTSDWGLASIVYTMPGGWDATIRVSDKGTGYRMSAKCKRRLQKALDEAWYRGITASFAMVDLETGVTVTSSVDATLHGASTFKAAYVTYIYEDLLETGWESNGNVYSLMNAAVGPSSNEAYMTLRGMYGTSGFRSWLNDVGAGWLASTPYPTLSARQLARVWMKIRAYEISGGWYVGQWHRMFNHSTSSCIQEALGSWEWVYSKPGWYPQVEGYAALNDAAIVWDENDKAYLLVILTDANCNSEHWILHDIAYAADAIHWEMVSQQG